MTPSPPRVANLAGQLDLFAHPAKRTLLAVIATANRSGELPSKATVCRRASKGDGLSNYTRSRWYALISELVLAGYVRADQSVAGYRLSVTPTGYRELERTT